MTRSAAGIPEEHRPDSCSAEPVPHVASSDPPEVFITNFHRNYTGVSATASAVFARQQLRHSIRLVGRPLPLASPPISLREAFQLSRTAPRGRPFAIWHVRRNLEMTAALFARDVLRLPIKIVFTSAAQRRHSAIPWVLISRMDAVVATTERAASFVPHVAALVPHRVDTERFTPPADRDAEWAASGLPGRYGIGVAGRIRPEKGTDVFVDAMLQLLPQRPDFTAVVVGCAKARDAKFEERLRAKIRKANLADRFVFVGEMAADDMPQVMRRLSILVAPARYEGYGMTPLEAMASGSAVVATDTGAYSEMVEQGRTGRVVPVEDVGALVAALADLTADPVRLAEMGIAARQRAVDHFSLDQEASGIASVYESLWSGQRF